MKKYWLPMVILGILLLTAVFIVTPFMLMQTVEIESVAVLETPLDVIAHAWCKWMILDTWWLVLTVLGAALTVGALVLRRQEKKK